MLRKFTPVDVSEQDTLRRRLSLTATPVGEGQPRSGPVAAHPVRDPVVGDVDVPVDSGIPLLVPDAVPEQGPEPHTVDNSPVPVLRQHAGQPVLRQHAGQPTTCDQPQFPAVGSGHVGPSTASSAEPRRSQRTKKGSTTRYDEFHTGASYEKATGDTFMGEIVGESVGTPAQVPLHYLYAIPLPPGLSDRTAWWTEAGWAWS